MLRRFFLWNEKNFWIESFSLSKGKKQNQITKIGKQSGYCREYMNDTIQTIYT